MQEGEQDADRLLLVPGQHQGQGQVIDPAVEGFGQGHSHLDGAVGIVALAHVHNAGQTADGAQVQVVEAELTAGQGEHGGIGRGLLDKLGVIAAAWTGAVTAAHQENVAQSACFYGVNDSVSHGQNGVMAETGGDFLAAVQAGEFPVLGETTQFQGLLDHRGEVLVLSDVDHLGVGNHLGGKDPVGVAGLRRHQAVAGEEDGSRQVGELSLLVLPSGAEVAFQVGILF